MNRLVFATLAISSLTAASVHAAERIPVGLAEGVDFATQPQIPTTTGPVLFLSRVNAMLEGSSVVVPPTLEVPLKAVPPLRLNLLALDTGTPNEIAYSFSIQQWTAGGRLAHATDLQLRTCQLAAADACATLVVRAVEAAAATLTH